MDELNDPQLESMLGRLSGAYPDANVAFVTVRGKVRQAKRRRAFVATTAACAMLLGVGVVAAQSGGGAGDIQPSDGLFITVESSHVSDTEASVETSEDTTEVSTESTTAVTETTTVDSTTADTTMAGGNEGQGGSPSTVSNSDHGNNNSSTSTSSTTKPITKPSTKPTVPTGQQTTTSKGGSLTFVHDGTTLTWVTATAADGFHEDEGARIVEPGRLRVEFTDGTTTYRIEVRLEGGKAPIETSQHG